MDSTMNGNPEVHQASSFLDVLRAMWPVMTVGFFASFFTGLQRIKNGYKGQSLLAVIGNQIFTSLGAMVIGFGVVLCLPMINPELGADSKLGIAILASILGQNAINLILIKYFGLKTLDLMDKDDIDHIHNSMSYHDRLQHAKQCPFKDEKEACDDCGYCKNDDA